MDILINEANNKFPFKIEFISYKNNEKEVRYLRQINKFTKNNVPEFIEDLELKEYDNLTVRFTSTTSDNDEEAKLFMDCFDYIDELVEDIELNQSNTGFIKLNQEIIIHRHLNNDVGSPLIPGVYKIKVIYKKEIYYSQVLIKPNNLDITEHYQMIKEIEFKVKGLARDWVRKNKSLDVFNEYKDIDPTYLDYATLLLKYESLLEYSINIILKNPYVELNKGYIELPFIKTKKLDSRALKLNQIKYGSTLYMKNPLSNEKVYTYNMVESYDNKVNIYLVSIVNDFIDTLKKSKLDIIELKKFFNNELNELKKYNFQKKTGQESKILNRNQQLKNILDFEVSVDNLIKKLLKFRNSSFMKSLKISHQPIISQQFIKTPGYNNFYRVSKILNGRIENQIEDLFDYNWKSTEVLYEYWCMIKLIDYLIDLDYKPVQGWIFEKDSENNKITIPAIPDGTSIKFKKEDYSLQFIFNSMIGKSPEQAKKNNSPYWIRVERNKPDFRLDVYKGDEFQKTIIMDAKYSPAKRFWNKKYINTSQKSKVVEQLKIYANNIYKLNTKRENVVEEVIAICPTLVNEKDLLEFDVNHSIGVATLKPGIENNDLMEHLERLITEDFFDYNI